MLSVDYRVILDGTENTRSDRNQRILMIYMWFTGALINWPLRKIMTLFFRSLRSYGNQA